MGGVANRLTMRIPQLATERQPHDKRRIDGSRSAVINAVFFERHHLRTPRGRTCFARANKAGRFESESRFGVETRPNSDKSLLIARTLCRRDLIFWISDGGASIFIPSSAARAIEEEKPTDISIASATTEWRPSSLKLRMSGHLFQIWCIGPTLYSNEFWPNTEPVVRPQIPSHDRKTTFLLDHNAQFSARNSAILFCSKLRQVNWRDLAFDCKISYSSALKVVEINS